MAAGWRLFTQPVMTRYQRTTRKSRPSCGNRAWLGHAPDTYSAPTADKWIPYRQAREPGAGKQAAP
jgi:hypothetical protein